MDSFNINISPETQEIVITQGEPINISINEEVIQINQKKEDYNLNLEGEVVNIDANYPQALEAARIATEKAEEATQIVEGFDTHAQEKIAEYNSNASDKIVEYNQNATEKTSTFNSNATSKTTAYNDNASAKLSAYNQNATDKTNEFNLNAQNKTSDFNSNATQKTLDFNSNATNKTTDFNDNYIAKKEIIDEKAEEASGYADTAKQWAVGEPTEPTGGSAKHWAQEAESSLSGLSSRVSNIEGLIPNTASPSNQLTDENFVNSSIATNTANFIGTFANVTALNAYSGTVTNNDYAFVTNSVVTDNGNDWATFNDLNAYDKSLLTDFDYAWVINGANFDLYRFDIVNQVWVQRATNIQKSSVTLNSAFSRYKATVNGSTTWNYEYTLNNSSFTAAQWAAINSGITGEKVALITPFTGADGTNAGTTGLVTAPSATDNGKFLKGDGTWGLLTASTDWGNITGTLSNQTDLQNALNAKQDVATAVHKIEHNTISKNVNLQPINTVVNVEGTGYTNSPQGDSSYWQAGVSLKVGKDDYYSTSGDWLRGWYLYGQWNNNPNLWYGTRATASDPNTATINWWKIPFINKDIVSTTSWDIISKKSYTLGTSPSSEIDGGIQIRDSNNAEISTIGHKTFSNGRQYVLLSSIKKSGNSVYTAVIRCGVDENNNVYTEAPTPATSDNSTKMATTAFVKNQGYALDSDVVKLTGNQTIGGVKTFNDGMFTKNIMPKGSITLGTSTNTWGHQLQFQDTAGKRIARIQPMAIDTTKNRMGMWVNNADNTVEKGIEIWSDGTTVAPTPATSDSSTKIATTAFVKNQGYIGSTNLVEVPVLVSRTANTVGGYTEIWSDGYCVQTGKLQRTATGILDITLPKEYINANYYIQATNIANETYTSASTFYTPYALNITTKGFSLSSNAAIANIKYFSWETKGYIS